MDTLSKTLRVAALAAALTIPMTGLAQTQPEDPVEARGVGISGGIIAGAELSLLVESFIDVKPVWPWIVVPILTAGGGGVGGYYLEQASSGGSIALLVSSMALLIPTAIAVSIARAYEIEDNGRLVKEDAALGGSTEAGTADAPTETRTEVEARPEGIPTGAGAEQQPDSASGLSARRERRSREVRARRFASGSLFHFDRDMGAGFGVPAIDVRPVVLGFDGALGPARTGLEMKISLVKIDLP